MRSLGRSRSKSVGRMQKRAAAATGAAPPAAAPEGKRRRQKRESPWRFFKDFRRVFPYMRPHKRLAFVSAGIIVASSVMALLSPWPLALLVDSVLGDKPIPSVLGPIEDLGVYGLLIFAVLLGLLITGLEHGLAVVDDYVHTKLDQNMVLDLRSDLFRHAQRLSLSFHDSKRTGALMYQINNQASAVGAVTVSLPPLIQSVLTLVGMFVVVYLLEPTLALVALTVVPFIYWSAGYYARRIEPRVMKVRSMEGQSLAIVHEAMAMMRVIVAFGREPYEYVRFRKQGEEAVDARVRLTVRQTLFSLMVTLITATGTALVLGFGAYHVIHNHLTTGELLVVMGYIASIYKPLEQISNTVSSLQEQFISLRGALDLLDTEPAIKERFGATRMERTAGHIAFEGVSFDYSGRRGTLKDVSFDATPGTRVAVVGPTGAGKSTLLSLVPRFYDPDRGRITLDGTDIRDLTLESLRAQISLVLQEPLLFSGSIGDNIRYGRLEAGERDVVEAAMAANSHDFISALPKGYDTVVGERGAQLSGGERQRISVARAFLKDAPILILDEPTSSIDSKTEGVILDALERLMEGRTTFMVAHRLSTIQHADLILVMNHGEVVEQGTHEELIALGGLYKELDDAQHGARRRRAAAAVSQDGLSEMTGAIAHARETGGELAGPALAELARAISDRGNGSSNGGDGTAAAAWTLVAAVRPLIEQGSAERLHALAKGTSAPSSSQGQAQAMARQLLRDLGLEADPPQPAAPVAAGAGNDSAPNGHAPPLTPTGAAAGDAGARTSAEEASR